MSPGPRTVTPSAPLSAGLSTTTGTTSYSTRLASDISVSGARVLKCFVKKLFGLLFMAICYFSVDLGYKPPKNLATLIYLP